MPVFLQAESWQILKNPVLELIPPASIIVSQILFVQLNKTIWEHFYQHLLGFLLFLLLSLSRCSGLGMWLSCRMVA